MGTSPQHSPSYRRLQAQLREMRAQAEMTQRALAAILKKPHSYVALGRFRVGGQEGPLRLGDGGVQIEIVAGLGALGSGRAGIGEIGHGGSSL